MCLTQTAHQMHTFCALSMNGLPLVSDEKLFFPDHIFQFYSHHALWLQQSVPLMPWPFLLAIAWFLPPNFLSWVRYFLQELFVYSSETLFASLHIIIVNFVAGSLVVMGSHYPQLLDSSICCVSDDFIIVYYCFGLNLVYCYCGLSLIYLTPGIWTTLICRHSVEWIA